MSVAWLVDIKKVESQLTIRLARVCFRTYLWRSASPVHGAAEGDIRGNQEDKDQHCNLIGQICKSSGLGRLSSQIFEDYPIPYSPVLASHYALRTSHCPTYFVCKLMETPSRPQYTVTSPL